MTLTENAYSAIETTLAKATARCRYTEIIPRTFLIGQNSQSWDQENDFSGQPIRRFIFAMSTNAGFVGAKTTNPFHYQKFGYFYCEKPLQQYTIITAEMSQRTTTLLPIPQLLEND